MKFTYYKIFIALVLIIAYISCTTETIKVNIKYSNINPVDSNTIETHRKDTICFYLNGGFGKQRIKVYQNGKTVYDKVLNITTTFVSSIEFRKQNENIIQIQINDYKTKEIKFDNRYNIVIVDWWEEKSEIDFDYWNVQPYFD